MATRDDGTSPDVKVRDMSPEEVEAAMRGAPPRAGVSVSEVPVQSRLTSGELAALSDSSALPIPDASGPTDAAAATNPAPSFMDKIRKLTPEQWNQLSTTLAQVKGGMDSSFAHTGAILQRAADKMIGLTPDDSAQARGEELAQAPIRDLIQQRDEARKFTADQRTKDLDDPNSSASQRAQLLAGATGTVPPSVAKQLTANMWSMMQQGATLAEAKREHDLRQQEIEEQRETQRGNLAREAGHDRDWFTVEMARINAQRAKEGKPPASIQDKEVQDLTNRMGALQNLNKLQDAQHQGLWHPLDYANLVNAEKGNLAPALNPKARGSAPITEMTMKGLPGPMTPNGAADVYWNNTRSNLIRDVNSELDALEASGKYSPTQMAEIRHQLAARSAGIDPHTGARVPVQHSARPVHTGPAPALPTTAQVKEPGGAPAPIEPGAQVVRKQINRQTNQTRLTYADGRVEVVNGI